MGLFARVDIRRSVTGRETAWGINGSSRFSRFCNLTGTHIARRALNWAVATDIRRDPVAKKVINAVTDHMISRRERDFFTRVNESTRLAYDLGFDSLDMAELLYSLEEKFKIRIETDEFRNVHDIISYIKYRLISPNEDYDSVKNKVDRINLVIIELALKLDPSLPKEKINNEADLAKDLKFDSLDFVELVMALEDHYDINIPDEAGAKFRSVGDVTRYLIHIGVGK